MGFRTISLINFNQKNIQKKLLIYKIHVEFSKEFLEIINDEISIGIESKPVKASQQRNH